jgi:hypothetical protein
VQFDATPTRAFASPLGVGIVSLARPALPTIVLLLTDGGLLPPNKDISG